MLVRDAIDKIKKFYKGYNPDGSPINDTETRDRILHGNPDVDCTGIVTTCFASIDVIEKAIETGANLIICHEALFWNRGDKTDWLVDNTVFQEKVKLLDSHGIIVWRNHDYIHSGMPLENGQYTDGIFYGVMNAFGWSEYLDCDLEKPVRFKIPQCTAKELAHHVKTGLNIDGIRVIGNPEAQVETVFLTGHVMGYNDPQRITQMEEEGIDAYIALELIDYTLSEYARDASQLGKSKVIIAPGHFNLEEVGMEAMLEYLPKILGEAIPQQYIQSGDSYSHF